MRCKEAIQEISNFIDGGLGETLKHELESHFAECEHCRLVVVQTKRTVEFFLESEAEELPADVKMRLHGMLRRKFGQRPA